VTEPAPTPARTACHGCRGTARETVVIDGEQQVRPVLLVGDGQIMREVSPGIMLSQPCPVCGDTDDPGWVPGFIPPV
jgi:hypothetical protein